MLPVACRGGSAILDSRDKWNFCLRAAWDALRTRADMARRTRRNHTPAFKEQAALAAIKSGKTMSELAQQFDLHANQIRQWRDQLLARAVGVFGSQAQAKPQTPAIDVKTLPATIGELTLVNCFLEGAVGKMGLLSARR